MCLLPRRQRGERNNRYFFVRFSKVGANESSDGMALMRGKASCDG